MNNTTLIEILKTVAVNGNLYSLTRSGYSPSQIALLLNEVINNQYVVFHERKLCLSDSGNEILKKHFDENKIKGSTKWIYPQNEYRIQPLSKYTVFLPKQFKPQLKDQN